MIRLGELAELIGATCKGDSDCLINSVADLRAAKHGQISFLTNKKYLQYLEESQASAIITSEEIAADHEGNFLIMKEPYLGYAKTTKVFNDAPKPASGIHPTAVIADDAILGENVSIGANSVVESCVQIGANSCIGPQVFLGHGVQLGDDCLIHPQVSIYHGVTIGHRAIIHSGAVFGSDGFGFANEGGKWVKIHQLGSIEIGDDFEAGANTTIDRGALLNTRIGNGVILDNLVHIAHNVSLGDNLAMAAMTGVAGGTSIGKGVTLAGRVSIIGHLEICDNAHVTVNTTVNKSITEPGVYSSGDVAEPNRQWRRKQARLKKLDSLFQRVKQLETELKLAKESKELAIENKENDND